jgi:hypothetical protein
LLLLLFPLRRLWAWLIAHKVVPERYWQIALCVFGAEEVPAALYLVIRGRRGVFGRLKNKTRKTGEWDLV